MRSHAIRRGFWISRARAAAAWRRRRSRWMRRAAGAAPTRWRRRHRRKRSRNIAASWPNIRKPATAFEQEAGAYWTAIADKRRGRNAKRREHQPIALDDYVLTQPPVYTGPKRPVNPAPRSRSRERPPRSTKRFRSSPTCCRPPPSISSSRRSGRPAKLEFKRAYARVAAAAGLTREQAVRVYSFETGGTGNYDVQAGIEHSRQRARSPPRSAITSCSPPTASN